MIILVDDDKLVRMSWKLAAAKANVHFTSYASFDQLLCDISKFDKNDTFYLDSQLKDGARGEVEAKKLADLGFKNLYIASGLSFEAGQLPDYIMGSISKRAPFA